MSVEAWAIKGLDGLSLCVAKTERKAWSEYVGVEFEDDERYEECKSRYKKWGYSCVRVRIEEVSDER